MKNDPEATIFCMTALGTTLLQQNTLEDVKVMCIVVRAGTCTYVHVTQLNLPSAFGTGMICKIAKVLGS